MSIFSCWWWWLLLGGLLGWLASWWFGRGAMSRLAAHWHGQYADNDGRHLATIRVKDGETSKLRAEFDELKKRPAPEPQVRVVEKVIEKPVDRVIEKVIERPVDRIVEKRVDNPDHLNRIRLLEGEVAVIAGLRSQLQTLQSAPPRVIEKIIDRPVERVVEKIVERPVDRVVERIVEKPVEKVVYQQVDNPQHLIRVRELESQVGLIAGLRTQLQTLQAAPPKIVDRPVDRIVEKIIDRPVDRVVERVVEKMVDNPEHLRRVRELEAQVGVIAGLRTQIQTLQSTPPKIVEKIVDRPVDRIVEKIVEKPVDRIVEKIVDRPVDRIVEKIVDRPVDRVVEKVVEKLVDNPDHLRRVRELEGQVAVIAGLRSQLQTLQSAPPKIVEKIVDRPVDRIVEKIVEKPVDRVVEKLVPDSKGIEERDAQLRALRQRYDDLERSDRERVALIAVRDEEIRNLKLRTVEIDRAAALADGFKVRGMDDLELVEGIGPKIAGLLNDAGVHYFHELARMTPTQIQVILDRAGPHYQLAKPDTWPEQAGMAASNRWADLRRLQDELIAGNRK